jgi:DNA-directed RNA polymerase subunit RPC12/RpoP
MRISKNYRINYICLGCGEEYSTLEVYNLAAEQSGLTKEEVICPICNGYIINPQGKACTKGVAFE